MVRKDLQDPTGGEGKRVAIASELAWGRRRTNAAGGLDIRTQEAIGRSLKAHYDELARAPIPDKFLELLERLEAKERSPKSHDGLDE
jgi:hypothetical protein